MSTTTETTWALEVVRGNAVGKRYAVAPGLSVLGNATEGLLDIDLNAEEGNSPRRMAPRQAEIRAEGQSLSLRDLDSPGGTFVNRRRILPGQAQSLAEGDVIQLAGIQLRVISHRVQPESRPPTARIGPMPVPYTTANGIICRSWDDFPTASSKDWKGLREELMSGRISTFLKSIHRDDLVQASIGGKTDDERLDAWLGRLPVSRPLESDLEVHPNIIRVRATIPGAMTRRSLSITNTGYRLLRCGVKVEPPETDWLRIAPPFDKGMFTTAETTEIPVEVTIPETFDAPRSASLVIESNAGPRTVIVHMERPAPAVAELPEEPSREPGRGLVEGLEAVNPRARLVVGAVVGLILRGLFAVGDLLVTGSAKPGMEGATILLAGIGAIAGLGFAIRRRAYRDVAYTSFSGGVVGVLLASVGVAASRSVEGVFGLGSREFLACLLWAVLCGLISYGLTALVPYVPSKADASS